MNNHSFTRGIASLLLSPTMLLGLLFVSFCVAPLFAYNPSYLPDIVTTDCSPSVPLSEERFASTKAIRYDVSAVTRIYAVDPGNRGRPQVSACVFTQQHTFSFGVSNGPMFVRFFFKPTSYSGLDISKAVFSISAGPYTLLTTTASSYTTSKSYANYVVREFCVNVDGPLLNVTFTPSSKTLGAYAFVNKIEVVSMPPKLYIEENVQLPLIGHLSSYSIEKFVAVEMMYRLNVGGNLIRELEDSGMFRRWTEDDDYLVSNDIAGNTSIVESGVKIRYSSQMSAYAAPAQVYISAREVLSTGDGKYRATWSFPLDAGFYYLVRLHFCEISSFIQHDGQRVFRIDINNQTVEDNADIFYWSQRAGTPIYRDYVVNFSVHGKGIEYLSIALGSKNGSSGRHENPILSGLEIFKLSDQSNNLAGLHAFGVSTGQHLSSSQFEDPRIFLLVVRWIGIGFMTTTALCFVCMFVSSYVERHGGTFNHDQSSSRCRIFSIAEIRSATKNFDDTLLIGTGGFGKVYKGSIDGGTTNVAIKRANPSSHQGLNEFQTEISMLSNLKHCHLVSLIGHSTENKEMVLVYAYMSQGTLRDHLYKTRKPPLPWRQRLKICIGAARGLHYLHTGSNHSIIHRDIKSTNILLDDKLVARVSDFGLSKRGPSEMTETKTHVSTMVKGSFGYLDPEYYRRQKLTEKSDVYSFGVVLFEVLCARPAVMPMGEIAEEEYEKANLADWASNCYQNGTLEQIIDPYLKGRIAPECFRTFTAIAKKCLGDKGNERPSMADVLSHLQLAMRQQESADLQGDIVSEEIKGKMECDLSEQSNGFYDSDPNSGISSDIEEYRPSFN